MRERWTRLELIAVFVALVFAATLRFKGIAQLELTHWDEGAYVAGPEHVGPFARAEPLAVYAPPLVPYAFHAARSVCGEAPRYAIVVVAVFGLLCVLGAALLARALGGRPAGVAAAWIVATSPLLITYSRLALTDVPFTAFVLFALASLVHAERRRSVSFAILGGVCAGLATLTKYHGFVPLLGYGLALIPCLLRVRQRRARAMLRRRMRVLLIAGLAYTPFFVAALIFIASDMGFAAFRESRSTWTVGLHPWTVRQAAEFFAESVRAFDIPAVAVVALPGVWFAWRKRGAAGVLGTALALAVILVAYRNYTRLLVPAIALVGVAAALAIGGAAARFAPRAAIRTSFVIAALLAVLGRGAIETATNFRSDAYARMAKVLEHELAHHDGVAILVGQYALIPYLSPAAANRVIAVNEPEARTRLAAETFTWLVFDEDPSRRADVAAAWAKVSTRVELVLKIENPLPPPIAFDRNRERATTAFDRELRLYYVERAP